MDKACVIVLGVSKDYGSSHNPHRDIIKPNYERGRDMSRADLMVSLVKAGSQVVTHGLSCI